MYDSYIVEVMNKRVDDRIFNELLNIKVCNKET